MRRSARLLLVTLALLAPACLSSCARPRLAAEQHAASAVAPPAFLLGEFVDDYENRYAITPTLWTQLPHGRFHVQRWDVAGQYLVARNDSGNRHAPGRWTRIDWVALPNMAPYAWAFCLSAYETPSAAAAESVSTARRETPRTGCNGYPFSRMRRASEERRQR